MKVFKNKYFLLILLFFAVVYSLIAIVNHYNFRTYALDLGAYTNALYDYTHFHWNDSTAFRETAENLLADHFDLYLILFAPLSLLFTTCTLLIVQIICILLGGAGVFKYFCATTDNKRIPLLATIYFFLFFGVFSAVTFDYHSNVVAAMIVPWFLFCIRKKKYLLSFILLVLMLISKENISIWLAFICLGLLIEYRKDKITLRYLLIFILISVAYFVLIIGLVMPAISEGGAYAHFNYSHFGNGPLEVLKTLFLHPIDALKTLFINHTHDPLGDNVKLELHVLLLISGLWMLVFKPQYLIMLIPIYFQKLFNDNFLLWSINYHYSVEFAPILAIGAFSALTSFKNKKWKSAALVILVAGCLACTIRIMDNTIIYTNKLAIRIYQAGHYKRDYNVKLVHEKLSSIPSHAIVSAQTQFLPHLALRDNIYQFPTIKNADYIVFSSQEGTYPLSKEKFKSVTDSLMNSPEWKVDFRNPDVVILERKNK